MNILRENPMIVSTVFENSEQDRVDLGCIIGFALLQIYTETHLQSKALSRFMSNSMFNLLKIIYLQKSSRAPRPKSAKSYLTGSFGSN